MTLEEAIRTIKAAQAEVEWEYPMDYAAAFDMAISALQEQELQPTCNNLATDTIYRRAAIDALGEEPEVWTGKDEYAQGLNNQWHYDVNALKAVPSAQPEGIPLEWIDKHLEWLDNCDNDFAQLAKVSIRGMVEIWKKDRT